MSKNTTIFRSSAAGRLEILIGFLLIVAILIVYFPVQHHGFISLDDGLYVTDNDHVQQGLSVEGLKWALTTDDAGFWIPLTWISLMIDSHLFGPQAGTYHVINVIIHLVNALLLFLVFRRMTGEFWPGALVAMLFAVHPIHVESVAWVSERKDVLFAFFWFLSIWFYARYSEKPGLSRYSPLIISFLLGLLAKPMMVTLPFVLLLLDYWPLKRMQIRTMNQPHDPRSQQTLPGLILEKVPLFVLTVIVSVITFMLQKTGGAITSLNALPVSQRIFNSLISYTKYIAKMIWPHPLAVLYPRQDVLPAWQWILSLTALMAVTALIIRYRKIHPFLPVGWLWFLGTMVPVIGFVQAGPQTMADRFAYIPFIGLYLMAAWGLGAVITRWPHRKIATVIIMSGIVITLMILAHIQVGYWSNNLTLYGHTLKTTSNNFVVHRNYGMALAYKGRLKEAHFHFQRALEIDPGYAQTYHDMGTTLMLMGNYDESIKYLTHSLKLRPNYSKSHNNLGLTLMSQGRIEEAEFHFRRALQSDPDSKKAHNNLKKILTDSGQ